MIDARREAQASLYVLGALPPDELREFEAALQSDLQLQLLVHDLRGTAGLMGAGLPQVASPSAPSQKVPDATGGRTRTAAKPQPVAPGDTDRDTSWMFWVPWALAACFAVLCVVLISLAHALRQQAVHWHEQLGEKAQEASDLQDRIAQLESRAAEQVTNYQTRLSELQTQIVQRITTLNNQHAAVTNQLQQHYQATKRQLDAARADVDRLQSINDALQAQLTTVPSTEKDRLANSRLAVLRPTGIGPAGVLGASLWNGADQRGLIVFENLPPLPPSQSYQLWLIDPKLAIPVNGGVLSVDASGSVRQQFTPVVRADANRFAVSIEPSGGSPTPTGKLILDSLGK